MGTAKSVPWVRSTCQPSVQAPFVGRWLRRLMSFNPPYYFIRSFRDVLIEHTLPPVEAWLSMGVWIVVILAIASFISNRLSNEVKDLI